MTIIQANRHFNDPNIARGFSNLAALFNPVSGSDAAGYATAAAKKAEAQRLADIFAYAADPNHDPERAARMGYAVGYDAGESPWGVSLGDETTRRGQDIEARTLRENNAADNQRAALTTLYGDLPENTTRPELPGDLAALFGLPPVPAQTGIVNVRQGERATLPGGEVIEGPPEPLSKTEWDAAQAERLRTSGAMSDEMLRAMIFGDTPLEQVQTPAGPRLATRPDAIGRERVNAVQPSELATLQNERETLARSAPGDPRIREYDARIAALGRGSGQDAYSVAVDKSLADRNTAIQQAASEAQAKLATLNYMNRLLRTPNLDTGAGAGARLELRKALKALGIEVGDVGSAEALRAVANQFALELRNPEGGAGMPGALSDRDREFLVSMVPGLTNTADGNRQILGFAQRLAQRSVEIERMRQAYVRENGRIDESFLASLTDFAEANPLFPKATPTGGSGDGQFRILKVE